MERASGVLMHITSLPGKYSVGSFGAAKDWIDLISNAGFGYWQVLPFCLPDEYNSPYKSFGAFSPNPWFIDIEKLYKDGLITKDELESSYSETPYRAEFERLPERMKLLAHAAEKFYEKGKSIPKYYLSGEARNFCKFMALREINPNREWPQWKKQNKNNPEVFTKVYDMWAFIYYEFLTEWEEVRAYARTKNVKIIGDIPIYVSWDSADVFSHKELFLLDRECKPTKVAGVPPDYFCKDGQNWGNPIYDWKAHKHTDFAWWRTRIAFNLSLFDGVRLDHFRGYESYYAIPANETTAVNGEWFKGPGMSFVKMVRDVCSCFDKNTLVIAEDLGVVDDNVRELVKESGFPGMRVLQFAFAGDKKSGHIPYNYENNSVAYTGTHDNNTVLGYIWEMSQEERDKMMRYVGFEGNWAQPAFYDSVLRLVFQSHAGLAMFPIQDLLLYGADTRLNRPGERNGNWSMRLTREQLGSADWNKFLYWNRLYGREN